MELGDIKGLIPDKLHKVIEGEGIGLLRPSQKKSVDKGLLKGTSLLVCTPTASGKTLIAELASAKSILEGKGKAVYIVPLKALASEKYKEFRRKYGHLFRIALSIGDIDSADSYLTDYDMIICTAEKLDSLLRHKASWLKQVSVVVVDEIHLLNDPGRGPTLEILLTMLRRILPEMQLLGLSATIGNPGELAEWLRAELVLDSWRPVKLHQGVYVHGAPEFY